MIPRPPTGKITNRTKKDQLSSTINQNKPDLERNLSH